MFFFYEYSNRIFEEIGRYFQGLKLRGVFEEQASRTRHVRKYYDPENKGVFQLGTFWKYWEKEHAAIIERINETIVNFAQQSKGIITLEKVNRLTTQEFFDLTAVFKSQMNRNVNARANHSERNS